MDKQTVLHTIENGKYKIVFERAASTKGVDGFKIEANGDDMEALKEEAKSLYGYARQVTDETKTTTQ